MPLESIDIRNKIIKSLRISKLTYANYVHKFFANWCYIHAQKQGLDMMFLLQNKKVQGWYTKQWEQIVESAFYYEYNIAEHIKSGIIAPQAYQDLLDLYPKSIESYFPGTLLKIIKKQSNDTSTQRHK